MFSKNTRNGLSKPNATLVCSISSGIGVTSFTRIATSAGSEGIKFIKQKAIKVIKNIIGIEINILFIIYFFISRSTFII